MRSSYPASYERLSTSQAARRIRSCPLVGVDGIIRCEHRGMCAAFRGFLNASEYPPSLLIGMIRVQSRVCHHATSFAINHEVGEDDRVPRAWVCVDLRIENVCIYDDNRGSISVQGAQKPGPVEGMPCARNPMIRKQLLISSGLEYRLAGNPGYATVICSAWNQIQLTEGVVCSTIKLDDVLYCFKSAHRASLAIHEPPGQFYSSEFQWEFLRVHDGLLQRVR